MMKILKAVDIDWDLTGENLTESEIEDLDLPNEIVIPNSIVPQEYLDSTDENARGFCDDYEDAICDYVSEVTGFCHGGLCYNIEEKPTEKEIVKTVEYYSTYKNYNIDSLEVDYGMPLPFNDEEGYYISCYNDKGIVPITDIIAEDSYVNESKLISMLENIGVAYCLK